MRQQTIAGLAWSKGEEDWPPIKPKGKESGWEDDATGKTEGRKPQKVYFRSGREEAGARKTAPAHTASHSATLGKGIGYSERAKEMEKGGIVEGRDWRIWAG